jgi:formamidopyrimidine-DNA glycosylase
MPEGPEVKRIVDQLNEALAGKTLKGIKILGGRYVKKTPDGIADFSTRLPVQIDSVGCKGKFIYFRVGNWAIWNTLGMSGTWSQTYNTHSRVLFEFENKKVFFTDMRNFGTLKFVEGKAKLQKKLDSLGPDMLAEDVTQTKFNWMLKKHGTKTVAEVLMNQKVMSGVGNYIKAEALYLAKISPHRQCYTLTANECIELKRAIRSVITTSYETGGSTFKTYSDFNDEVGTFSDRFMVYGRKIDPQGNKVIKQETKDKRTTHWVPAIQK